MALTDRIYWRTEAGERALTSGDPSVPADYRRVLRVIDGRTHSAVIQGCLRQYPDLRIESWLSELEDLGYLSSTQAEVSRDLDFTDFLRAPQTKRSPVTPEDSEYVESQVGAAAPALQREGVFLADSRLANRAPLTKRAGEITILVVEDDPDQAALADHRLSKSGYKVHCVPDSKGLLKVLHGQPLPDLVLLDVMLPDVTGFDILAHIRRYPTLASLPVILLTALVEREHIRHGLALGADGYMTKPYSEKLLADTIRNVLKHAE